MKLTLFSILVIVFATMSCAQNCIRNSDRFIPTDIVLEGKSSLEQNADASLVLRLSSTFKTDGPDLHVYLSKSATSPTSPGSQSILLGELKAQTGEQTYNVPIGVGLGDYTYVLIHCVQYNHFYGSAKLNATEGVCSLTPVAESFSEEEIKISPNPSSGILKIDFPATLEKINAITYDGEGMKVHEALLNTQQGGEFLDLSALAAGMYIVKIASGKKVLSKKIILND